MTSVRLILRVATITALAAIAGGCDWDDKPDHIPPAGYGAIFVENNTSQELKVYVDGRELGRVGAYRDRPFDLRPGVYRVVLDQRYTERNWRDNVDVIEGRLTVLDVSSGSGLELDVQVFFE